MAKRKIIIGTTVFVLGQISPLIFIPIIISLDLPVSWTTILSGIFMFGIPEIAILISVVIMGKEGFNFIKSKFFSFLKKYGPPDRVSPARYKIGLVLFIIPLLVGLILPYISEYIPFYADYKNVINLSGDVMLIISLFVLGGDFWDKLRSLFVQNMVVKKEGNP